MVEPFFISTPEKPFDVTNFYSVGTVGLLPDVAHGVQSVLLPNNLVEEEDIDPADPSVRSNAFS
jgi:hypothetical protein